VKLWNPYEVEIINRCIKYILMIQTLVEKPTPWLKPYFFIKLEIM
jgi:hypothetical protein